MSKEIDARGLSCPGPVLQTKQAIDREAVTSIQVMVDNDAARQNVSRFLESQHFSVSSEKDGADFVITGKREGDSPDSQCSLMESSAAHQKKIMVMITTDRIGHGDDALGTKLMAAFLKTLKEMGNELWRLVLLNSGVKMTIDDSPVLPSLNDLERDGIKILVCGTCLDHFGLLEKKQVGETTNMLDIVTAMQLADKVINI